MNNDDLKQLKVRILIDLGDQRLVEHYVLHDNFKYHKLNGPAAIESNGSKSYLANNAYHRTNGPAIIEYNGNNYWYLNNKLIRTFQYE